GARARGVDERLAAHIFDLMEKFAGYGFNKSHAAAYALLAYQTAYMKTHHGAAFMAANMSAIMGDTDKVRQFRDDAVANGLTILPPDINASGYRFFPVDRNTVRYGLGAVRGTGEGAIDSILQARKQGPFTDLFDLCRRVDKRLVNRRCIEALVRAGAFDGFNANRATLLASTGRAIEAAEQAERSASQTSLFGEADPSQTASLVLVEARPWDLKQRLTEEKAALGYCLSGHLFSVYEPELKGFPRSPLAKIASAGERVWVAGVVTMARVQMTRRGRMMAVVIDDGTAQQEISVFNEQFEQHRDKLKEDRLLVVQGKVQRDEFSGGFRVTADDLLDIASLRTRFSARLRIEMNGGTDTARDPKRLMDLLAPYRASGAAGCPVLVHYENAGAVCDVALGETWRVRPDELLLGELSAWLSPSAIQFLYANSP
ncbi:MAG: OB-fold nucleic acid binding domain-containing protein, partial [Burkholderiales bacterium]